MRPQPEHTKSYRKTMTKLLIISVNTLAFGLIWGSANFAMEPDKQVVNIGIIAPLDEDDEHGRSHLQGATAKFNELKNEVEKVTGLQLRLIAKDSHGKDTAEERDKALTHAHELVEHHQAVAILGAVNSHATIEIQKYVETLTGPNTILITSSSTKTSITDHPNTWTFRNNLSDQKLTEGLAHYMHQKGLTTAAIFYKEGVWGEGAFQDFHNAYKRLGGTVLFEKSFAKEEYNYQEEMLDLGAKGVQAIGIFAGDFSKYKILKAKLNNPQTKNLPAFTIGLPHRLEEASG
ncbi:MAG: ABC transporter substrate-binding protein, partial [Nitrospirota bacterium]|nr:ABC transporter substrate-binding protein [Nitrospirota bacterium]